MFMAGRAIRRWKTQRVESKSRRETASQASAGAIGLQAVRPTGLEGVEGLDVGESEEGGWRL